MLYRQTLAFWDRNPVQNISIGNSYVKIVSREMAMKNLSKPNFPCSSANKTKISYNIWLHIKAWEKSSRYFGTFIPKGWFHSCAYRNNFMDFRGIICSLLEFDRILIEAGIWLSITKLSSSDFMEGNEIQTLESQLATDYVATTLLGHITNLLNMTGLLIDLHTQFLQLH